MRAQRDGRLKHGGVGWSGVGGSSAVGYIKRGKVGGRVGGRAMQIGSFMSASLNNSVNVNVHINVACADGLCNRLSSLP